MKSADHSTNIPLISIITVCYNAAATIARTGASIAQQPSDLYEWVVVDGASSDQTLQIIGEGPVQPQQLMSEPDAGLYEAMNKGVALARGSYLLFLNSDDWLEAGVLQQVADKIEQQPGADVYFGGILAHHSAQEPALVYPHGRWATSMPAFQPAAFVHRAAVPGSQWFDLKYRIAADFKFFKKLQREGHSFVPLAVPITHYSTDGISANDRKRLAEMQQILVELGLSAWLASLHCQRILWQEKLLYLRRKGA